MLIFSNGDDLEMGDLPINVSQDNPVEVDDDATSEWPD
jgi:hypothetical protein